MSARSSTEIVLGLVLVAVSGMINHFTVGFALDGMRSASLPVLAISAGILLLGAVTICIGIRNAVVARRCTLPQDRYGWRVRRRRAGRTPT